MTSINLSVSLGWNTTDKIIGNVAEMIRPNHELVTLQELKHPEIDLLF